MTVTTGPAVLARILETGSVETADGESIDLHSHVTRAEGEFLQRIIRDERPRRSLEIGLAYGVSTLFMCEALAEVGAERHVVIDPYQFGIAPGDEEHYSSFRGWRGVGIENVRRAGYGDLVALVQERSEYALPRMAAAGETFDFAFIDGYHTFEAAFVDFFYVDRMLRVGGVVAFDDLTYPGVRKVVRFAILNRSYVAVPGPPAPAGPSWRRRLLEPLVRSKLKPEIAIPDHTLGIGPQWIALRKRSPLPDGDAPGARRWDAHTEF